MTQLGSKKYECACGWRGIPKHKDIDTVEGPDMIKKTQVIIVCPNCKSTKLKEI